jgi:hypothetical protein
LGAAAFETDCESCCMVHIQLLLVAVVPPWGESQSST